MTLIRRRRFADVRTIRKAHKIIRYMDKAVKRFIDEEIDAIIADAEKLRENAPLFPVDAQKEMDDLISNLKAGNWDKAQANCATIHESNGPKFLEVRKIAAKLALDILELDSFIKEETKAQKEIEKKQKEEAKAAKEAAKKQKEEEKQRKAEEKQRKAEEKAKKQQEKEEKAAKKAEEKAKKEKEKAKKEKEKAKKEKEKAKKAKKVAKDSLPNALRRRRAMLRRIDSMLRGTL